ncbi:class I SAM-dependent methyltransferase [Cytophagaceae bacterium ABcell3]|nr:class I SAM-dependent methyltransferase [Cytophagaceae bacterium ABcell3]
MFKKVKKVDSKEVGLEIGLLIFKFFLKTEYLHYGLFSNGLKGDVGNLAQAQKNYAEFLMDHIPEGVNKILDVGCGSGKMARTLVDRGYKVDAVSPGVILTEHARKLLGSESNIFQMKFENMNSEIKYDLVIFSESFQYIPIDSAFQKALEHLNPEGHIMICDFFKTDPEKKSLLGGGHEFEEFTGKVKTHPVHLVKEQDITAETAPTIDIVNDLSKEVLHPAYNLIFMLAEDRFPWVAKFVKWKYKKKLGKMQNKHFTGQRSGENFKKYKKYMFYLYKKG